jgi:hypothetical protein
VGELVPGPGKLTESMAAVWKLSSQSNQINSIQDRKSAAHSATPELLQLLNSCNVTRAGEAMATWFTIEQLRNIHG